MSIADILSQILLGSVAGMFGQGIRVIIGLKKLADEAGSSGQSLRETLDVSRLIISLLIGAIAGGVGVLTISNFNPIDAVTGQLFFSLIGIGYAGTDFIEGFIQKYLPVGQRTIAPVLSPTLLQTQPRTIEAEAAWAQLPNARSHVERVAEAKRLLAEGKVYPRGCSEFVCAVLGISYQVANDLLGTAPTSVGARPPYDALSLGDIVGWKNDTGMGHVAVYVGESDAVAFIDVREPGVKPRSKNGFYDHELFKSSLF